ncbi:hypothetical protein [Ructibacterium gallinarum]|uniref:SbsA Ig-like domain-containing protein n=1 Tax=Ructibacterium gallinarum TaxID=2779355 RepID=A0A9D5M7D5_9FIRM|nr:hypothetical protein [Ructibacterium gallinarum]MBE5040907.1 hypothetical protein [Ructibacterium gallinarum]
MKKSRKVIYLFLSAIMAIIFLITPAVAQNSDPTIVDIYANVSGVTLYLSDDSPLTDVTDLTGIVLSDISANTIAYNAKYLDSPKVISLEANLEIGKIYKIFIPQNIAGQEYMKYFRLTEAQNGFSDSTGINAGNSVYKYYSDINNGAIIFASTSANLNNAINISDEMKLNGGYTIAFDYDTYKAAAEGEWIFSGINRVPYAEEPSIAQNMFAITYKSENQYYGWNTVWDGSKFGRNYAGNTWNSNTGNTLPWEDGTLATARNVSALNYDTNETIKWKYNTSDNELTYIYEDKPKQRIQLSIGPTYMKGGSAYNYVEFFVRYTKNDINGLYKLDGMEIPNNAVFSITGGNFDKKAGNSTSSLQYMQLYNFNEASNLLVTAFEEITEVIDENLVVHSAYGNESRMIVEFSEDIAGSENAAIKIEKNGEEITEDCNLFIYDSHLYITPKTNQFEIGAVYSITLPNGYGSNGKFLSDEVTKMIKIISIQDGLKADGAEKLYENVSKADDNAAKYDDDKKTVIFGGSSAELDSMRESITDEMLNNGYTVSFDYDTYRVKVGTEIKSSNDYSVLLNWQYKESSSSTNSIYGWWKQNDKMWRLIDGTDGWWKSENPHIWADGTLAGTYLLKTNEAENAPVELEEKTNNRYDVKSYTPSNMVKKHIEVYVGPKYINSLSEVVHNVDLFIDDILVDTLELPTEAAKDIHFAGSPLVINGQFYNMTEISNFKITSTNTIHDACVTIKDKGFETDGYQTEFFAYASPEKDLWVCIAAFGLNNELVDIAYTDNASTTELKLTNANENNTRMVRMFVWDNTLSMVPYQEAEDLYIKAD